MSVKKGERRRYFYRVGEREEAEVAPRVSPDPRVESSSLIQELPHNSVSIPAHGYSFFMFGVYAVSLFFLVVFFLFNATSSIGVPDSLASQLVSEPRNFSMHVAYARSLAENYKLREARSEYTYLTVARQHGFFANGSQTELSELSSLLQSRENAFHGVVREYAYWLQSLKSYPNYRDGLYRIAQLDYMLYNEDQAQKHLLLSSELDPRFALSRAVLTSLTSDEYVTHTSK